MDKTITVQISKKNPSQKCEEDLLRKMYEVAEEFTQIYGVEVEIEIEYLQNSKNIQV